jgi:signal transduction histidine kinase/GAF domain-containing protein
MEPGQAEQLEYILGNVAVGVAILDPTSLSIRYANAYLQALLDEPWHAQDLRGHGVEEVIPPKLAAIVVPLLRQVAESQEPIHHSEIPYEGFLESRGRTYWRVAVEHKPKFVHSEVTRCGSVSLRETSSCALQQDSETEQCLPTLLVTIEDVTTTVRSRLHLNAIHYITSAIAGPSSLHLVLERILQALHEMVGSKRCAIFLMNQSLPSAEIYPWGQEETAHLLVDLPHNATMAAQHGIHQQAQDWHPQVNEHTLLGRSVSERRTIIITDTGTTPEIDLPLLDKKGLAYRPGSVLCVPIFEPQLEPTSAIMPNGQAETTAVNTNTVLGTIEVYHRRARDFPAEEVELLERFAQQASQAIQKARLFRSIDHLARAASHQARLEVAARERIEAEVIQRTAELKQRNDALLQVKAAQELANARMILLLKHLPSGVILVSARDTAIALINYQAIQILQSLGAPLQPLDDPNGAGRQAIGMSCEQLLRPLPARSPTWTLIPYEEQPLHQALTLGKTAEAELHMVRADGQAISLLVNTAPLHARDGTVTNAILVLQDLTRTKALERAREDFFTTMAHELKTPLANIRAHLSALLARDLKWSSEEQYDFLQTADEQVERLVGMINHFLDASRVEAGALRLALEPIFIPELFEDLQDRLSALITSSNRTLQIDQTAPLPAVVGDYELIMSVLTNLMSNAFRYAPEGDAVEVSAKPLYSEQDPHQAIAVSFSVTDRGPGISAEQQATLFTRFSTFAAMHRPSIHRPGQPIPEWPRRMSKTSRWSPTTGLGLYISQGILEAHGSTLLLTSNPGQGTTFAFTLPVFKGKPEQGCQADQNKSEIP